MLVSWSTIFEAFLETVQMVSISFIFYMSQDRAKF